MGRTRAIAEQRIDHRAHEQRADDGAVLGRDIVDVCRCDVARGARHVVDDDAGITGNVFADMARDHSAVEIVAAAGRRGDDDGDGLALVELRCGILRCGAFSAAGQQPKGEQQPPHARPTHADCLSVHHRA
jgi:hypothetical protein